MGTHTATQFTSRQKAAMLLISLGPERSAKIFKHLKEEEIEDLTLEISSIRSVSPKAKEEVLQEFYEICLAQDYIAEGGIGYARQLLEKALGAEKALEVINRLTVSLQVRPFEFARKADAAQLINFIQSEHPQTIALILSYLKPTQAATILTSLPEQMQAETARRIAVMDRASPEVISEIEKEFEKRLSTLVSQDYTSIGGIDSIVEIIGMVDRATEKNIMENLEIEDPELAETIKKRMFVFEDITTLDNRSIQRVLREVDNHELAIALKGAGDSVKQVILSNVSQRLATMIKEDLEYMGPKRMKEIEDAQQKIVNIIRKLEDTGEIVISRGAGDEIIV
ncbi:MAG: flagellar motor switch protein FliG [Cellulosilyticaceae bacterium]